MASLDRPAAHYQGLQERLAFTAPDHPEIQVEVERRTNPATERIHDLSGQISTVNGILRVVQAELQAQREYGSGRLDFCEDLIANHFTIQERRRA